MKSYPVCGLDYDWTHRSTLKNIYSNTNQIRNSSGKKSRLRSLIPHLKHGVFEMGRVKISSSMQFGCVFWGSMKKYIHIYTYIHIWFIWYCNWICFFPRCCIHTVYLPEKFSHKMQVRIPHTSSQSYTIICMYNIPKTWCFCSTWTRRPTGCVQTTRNVGGFIEKKGVRMRNGVKFDATPSLPKIGVVCLVKGKVGALKSEDSMF